MKIKLNVKAPSMSCCTTTQTSTNEQSSTQVKIQKESSFKLTKRKNRVEEAYGGEEKDALAARGGLGSRVLVVVP